MASVSLTRRYRFSAAHRLHSPTLGDDANREIYGKCNNPYGHGHDYVLEVTVHGPVDERLGRLLPVETLDRMVARTVLDGLDRRNLNVEVEEFAELVPTTENLALVVAERLRAAWGSALAGEGVKLEKVKIHETKRNIFEVFEDQERESA
jgi:6-pyruvoyltetrahydropterin/6-carboxytetrahydropterin synthase